MAASGRRTKAETHRKGPSTDAKREGQKQKTPKKLSGKARAEKEGRGIKKPSRQVLGRQASQELLKLRPILRDVESALMGRLDGELAGLARSLDGGGMPGETPVLPQAPVLTAMLADIKALKVKPKKGRVKDLRRIEALLESLSARIPPGA